MALLLTAIICKIIQLRLKKMKHVFRVLFNLLGQSAHRKKLGYRLVKRENGSSRRRYSEEEKNLPKQERSIQSRQ